MRVKKQSGTISIQELSITQKNILLVALLERRDKFKNDKSEFGLINWKESNEMIEQIVESLHSY